MSFSFQPDMSQQGNPPEVPQAPAASFGAASSQTLEARHVEGGKSLIQLILSIILGGMVLVALGLVGYKFYLSSQVETKKASLDTYGKNLQNLPLDQMRKVSTRMRIINQLVKEHPSANVAFRIVEESIENQITYQGMELRYNEQTKGYTLSLRGNAPDYKTVAQQIDTLKRKPYSNYISNLTIDGLAPDDVGKIGFTLRANIQLAGLLPEDLNLSDGAAARIASSTTQMATSTASSSIVIATSTQPLNRVATSTTQSPNIATSTASTTPKR